MVGFCLFGPFHCLIGFGMIFAVSEGDFSVPEKSFVFFQLWLLSDRQPEGDLAVWVEGCE